MFQCRKAAAICFAGSIVPFHIWISTHVNPADEPSSRYGIRSRSDSGSSPPGGLQVGPLGEALPSNVPKFKTCSVKVSLSLVPPLAYLFVHLFSGFRRDGDLEDVVSLGLPSLRSKWVVWSLDRVVAGWGDLRSENTWIHLFRLVRAGVLRAAMAGPPCETFSKARHKPGGPRPVRSRTHLHGLPDLLPRYVDQVAESNYFVKQLFRLYVLMGPRGLTCVEHPDDPGAHPFPSMWLMQECLEYQTKCFATVTLLDMCRFGWSSRKPTRLLHTFVHDYSLRLKCNHGTHGNMIGKTADGSYNTGPSAQYSNQFCSVLGRTFLEHMSAV